MTLDQGTTSCHLDFAEPESRALELEIYFEDEPLEQGHGLSEELAAAAKRVVELEAAVEDERRRRGEVQHALEALEDRYETFVRERSALDRSAQTLHERFRARTERLYASLLRREGGIGAQVADATRELMEASEHLIRLQSDRDSLIRQVERLRLALRRAQGLAGEREALAEKDDESLTLLQTFKGDIERRLASFTRGLESRLDALADRLPRAPVAAPMTPLDFAMTTSRFYADGPLAEVVAPTEPPSAESEALDRIADQVQASPEPETPAAESAAPVEVAPPSAEPMSPVEPTPPAEPETEPFMRSVTRVAPAAPGMERILETRRLARSSSRRLARRDSSALHVLTPPRPSLESVKCEPRPSIAPAPTAERSLVASAAEAVASSRLGLTLVAGSVAGVIVSLLIASSSLGDRSFPRAYAEPAGAVAPVQSESVTDSHRGSE